MALMQGHWAVVAPRPTRGLVGSRWAGPMMVALSPCLPVAMMASKMEAKWARTVVGLAMPPVLMVQDALRPMTARVVNAMAPEQPCLVYVFRALMGLAMALKPAWTAVVFVSNFVLWAPAVLWLRIVPARDAMGPVRPAWAHVEPATTPN